MPRAHGGNDAPDFAPFGTGNRFAAFNDRFDPVFNFVRELKAVLVEPFDAVVFHGVVACGNHDRRVRFVQADEIRHGGSGQNTNVQHVPTDGADARRERSSQHGAGLAGIHADQDAGGMHLVCQNICADRSDLIGQFAA
ncbi:hypothetical protein SDC9_113385 [bioreactor metagenome]|uniref:Uncharacterized protein n=1 Tax=bioreactor metagenome TaxID=1076179 RepID=A0A645BMX4_9ZZZZ